MRWFLFAPLLLAGCPPEDSELVIVDESFEDQLSLRWEVDGTVEQVETYHPAEHGARFATATSMTIAPNRPIWRGDYTWLEYSTSCGGSPELWMETEGQRLQIHLAIPQEPDATPDEFERVYLNTPLPPVTTEGDWELAQLAVHVNEGGPCVIDNLRLMQEMYAW